MTIINTIVTDTIPYMKKHANNTGCGDVLNGVKLAMSCS